MPKQKPLYADVEIQNCIGKNALTADQAKELLGWQECKIEPLLTDEDGTKIRCCNNMNNRPYQPNLAAQYCQEILRKKWQYNGQSRIISEHGNVLSGQHSLIALVLADQKWQANKSSYPKWRKRPTIETLIVFGVSENEDVVDTIDTGKTRTLGDVLYRAEMFADMPTSKRKTISLKLEAAIKMLWLRTGVETAFNLRQTHSESRDFLSRHSRLVDCVKYIHDEDQKGSISKFIPAGAAAALMFLMATCESNGDEYHTSDDRNESDLNFDRYDDACDFFALLSQQGAELRGYHKAYHDLCTRLAESNDSPTIHAKMGLITLAWQSYSDHKKVKATDCKLHYRQDDDLMILVEHPTVGGIDIGRDSTLIEIFDDPTPEEIEQRKKEIDNEKKKAKPKAKPKATKKKFAVSDRVVVSDPDGDWEGTITKIYKESAEVQDDEQQFDDVMLENLSHV